MSDSTTRTTAATEYECMDPDCRPQHTHPIPASLKYRIALRPDENGDLDDVVVNDVEMFRAEMMDDDSLWLCCYLEHHDRVTFWVRAHRNKLYFTVTEQPRDVIYEDGSL